MNRVETKRVSSTDIEQQKIQAVKAEGIVNLEIHEDGNVAKLTTGWINFYNKFGKPALWAYFGRDNGRPVPAVYVSSRVELQRGTHEIKHPADPSWEVLGLFGDGHPNGGIYGDEWGKGILKVDEVSKESYKGSFEFILKNLEGKVVKVVGEFAV